MYLEDHCLCVISEPKSRCAWRIILVLGGFVLLAFLAIKLGAPPAYSRLAAIVAALICWKSYGNVYQVVVRSLDIFATFGEAKSPVPWSEIESISHSDEEIVLNLADEETRRINIKPFRPSERGQLIQIMLLTHDIFKAEGAPKIPHRPVKIETPRLVIRQLTEKDVEDYDALKQDPSEMENQLYDAFSSPLSQAIFEEELEQRRKRMLYWHLGLFVRESDEFVGYLTVNNFGSEVQRSAQFGIGICSHFRSQGFATEAIKGLLDFLEEETSLQKVSAGCFARNESCIRALENAGMRRIGCYEKYWFRDGAWIDGFVFEKVFHRVEEDSDNETASREDETPRIS